MGIYWENGKENGNYYLGIRVQGVEMHLLSAPSLHQQDGTFESPNVVGAEQYGT